LVEIPGSPLLFNFSEDGLIDVHKKKCPIKLRNKAKNSIALLELNSNRLLNFREAIIDELREQLLELEIKGNTEE
jgi:hypothetical protein